MTESEKLVIDKWKTLCVSGHRKLQKKVDLKRLKAIFNEQIDSGIDTFLVGMAIGFDTICFNLLEKIRDKDKRDIRIIACIPCPEQDKFFSDEQKKEYKRMLSCANFKVTICPNYTSYCMMKRNRYMVDNSSVIVAYLTEEKGGTQATVKYAKEIGLKCFILTQELDI